MAISNTIIVITKFISQMKTLGVDEDKRLSETCPFEGGQGGQTYQSVPTNSVLSCHPPVRYLLGGTVVKVFVTRSHNFHLISCSSSENTDLHLVSVSVQITVSPIMFELLFSFRFHASNSWTDLKDFSN